jgi:ATP-dependent Clp protease ATP-binding subunit ClpX
MGAFSGLEDIIATRLSKKTIGFGEENLKVKSDDSLLKQVKMEDIFDFGLLRELCGRLQVVVPLNPLDEETLCQVLIEPKDSFIKQYQQLMKYDDINLNFSDEAIKKIAKLAIVQKTGARSLKSILEQSLMNLMYKLPGSKTKKYTVTENDIIERM